LFRGEENLFVGPFEQMAYGAVSAEPVVFQPVAERIAGPLADIDFLKAIDHSVAQVKQWFPAFWIGAVVDHIQPPNVRTSRSIDRD
jgi:hypothetical protein